MGYGKGFLSPAKHLGKWWDGENGGEARTCVVPGASAKGRKSTCTHPFLPLLRQTTSSERGSGVEGVELTAFAWALGHGSLPVTRQHTFHPAPPPPHTHTHTHCNQTRGTQDSPHAPEHCRKHPLWKVPECRPLFFFRPGENHRSPASVPRKCWVPVITNDCSLSCRSRWFKLVLNYRPPKRTTEDEKSSQVLQGFELTPLLLELYGQIRQYTDKNQHSSNDPFLAFCVVFFSDTNFVS